MLDLPSLTEKPSPAFSAQAAVAYPTQDENAYHDADHQNSPESDPSKCSHLLPNLQEELKQRAQVFLKIGVHRHTLAAVPRLLSDNRPCKTNMQYQARLILNSMDPNRTTLAIAASLLCREVSDGMVEFSSSSSRMTVVLSHIERRVRICVNLEQRIAAGDVCCIGGLFQFS
jgi:hypothetical protein